ncbi:hypothetical protein IWX49DRAFT_105788 [Phyllosticta citricarpa]|uniref:Uncharacterized protein n=2 Tax=Phyllosticta TaxID=121621 RepID=A0ABR1MHQ8_9PEZI
MAWRWTKQRRQSERCSCAGETGVVGSARGPPPTSASAQLARSKHVPSGGQHLLIVGAQARPQPTSILLFSALPARVACAHHPSLAPGTKKRMSFDLLAEFAKPSSTAAPSRASKPPAPAPAGSGPASQPGRKQFSFFDDLTDLNPTANSTATPGSSNNFGAFGGLASLAPAGPAGPVPAAATASAQPPQNPPPPPTTAQVNNSNDEDDDWGDFTDAAAPQPPASLAFSNPNQQNQTVADPWDSLRTATSSLAEATGVPKSTATPPAQLSSNPPPADDDPFGLGLLPNPSTQIKKPSAQSIPAPQAPEKKPTPPRDPNVLFDAENLSDEDDFGDFEGTAEDEPAPSQQLEAAKPAQPAPTTALNIDSLINDLELSGGLSAKAPSSKRQDWKSSTSAKLAARAQARPESTPISSTGTSPGPPTVRKLQPAAQPVPLHDEDEWADFTETVAPKPASTQSSLPAGINIPSTPNSPPDPLPNALPPTNIPPPFLLLCLFPPIFASAQTTVFKPLGAQPPPVRTQILSHERTMRFLRSYLSIGIVAARVIAGRKLRWKRDGYLAQGMSIGPAGRAGGGGMKVVKLDRSEERREDSQAEEVVRAWREQVGRLRSLVVQVNSKPGARLGNVPEVAETMAVRTAKEAEGGVPGTRPCALCGLKRNERIAKVDIEVEDSFGEWWVEGVSMHRACRNFWEGNKDRLKGM